MKRQSSLTEWLTTKHIDPRKFFVLDTNFSASFLPTRPANATVVCDVLVRRDGFHLNFTLCRVSDPSVRDTRFQPVLRLRDKSLLISMLQKAVRRQNHAVAASTALEMIHLDALSLARRLPIIAVEDVRANRNVVGAVWLMLAWSNGVAPMATDVVWLVQLSEAISRDSAMDARFRLGDVPSLPNAWKRAETAADDVGMALLVRSMHGGMQGDVDMLIRAGAADHRDAEYLELPLNEVPRLDETTAICEGVDYHCEPKMIDTISTMHNLCSDSVREAIWTCSSCLNKRMLSDEEAVKNDVWERIRDDVRRMQKARLRTAFRKGQKRPLIPFATPRD